MSGCGHDHSTDPMQGVACELLDIVKDVTKGELAVGVVLLSHDRREAKASTFGNVGAFAMMAHAIMTNAVRENERPSDCPVCADAYDRMRQALAMLNGVQARC